MARFYSSYTTRYGDTLTGDSNISLIDTYLPASDFVVNGDNITINATGATTASRWDGLDADDDPAEVVFWQKNITVNDERCLVAEGVNGSHVWFVNCVITINGGSPTAADIDQAQRLGPSREGDTGGPGTRQDSIGATPSKSNETTWNYINCTFIFNTTDGNNSGVMVVGDLIDCTFRIQNPDGDLVRLYPMQRCVWARPTWDFSTSNQDMGHAYELFNQPESTDNFTLINAYGYTGDDRNVTYNQYSCDRTTADSSGNEPLYRIYAHYLDENINTVGTTTNFVSPKSDLTPDGAIYWRHPTNLGCAILRQRYQRRFYQSLDFSDSNGSDAVKVFMNTDFVAVDATGTSIDPDKASSKTLRVYETESDGILESTWDFNVGQVEANDNWGTTDNPIDIPLITLRCASSVINDADAFETDEELYDTEVTEMSLWGVHFESTITKNKANNYNTAADEETGLWIDTDIETIVDANDPMMDYADNTVNNIFAALISTDANATAGFNDFAGTHKYQVWTQGTGDLGLDQWSTGTVTGSVFDISEHTRDKVEIEINGSGDSARPGTATDEVIYRMPSDSDNIADIVVDENDIIQTMICEEFNMGAAGSFTLKGGALQTNVIEGLTTHSDIPADFSTSYSLSETKISNKGDGGNCEVKAATGTHYLIFNDLKEGTQINVTKAGTGVTTVLLTGDTDADDVTKPASESDVEIKRLIRLELTRPDTVLAAQSDVSSIAWTSAANATAAAGNTYSTSASDIQVSGNTYTIDFEIDADNTSSVWAAVAIDGFEIVRFTGVTGTNAVTLEAIDSSRLNFSDTTFGEWGAASIAESDVTVADITSLTTDIVATIDETGNDVDETGATDSKVRTLIRKYIIESTAYLKAFSLGFIPDEYITFANNFIVLADTDSSPRFKLGRTADTSVRWSLASKIVNANEVDLWNKATVSGYNGQQIDFAPVTTGASDTVVISACNDIRDQIVGHTDLPDDSTGRNVKEAYTQAKGAKNAAFAAG